MGHPARDIGGGGAVLTGNNRRLNLAALVSLGLLVVGNLAYPDTAVKLSLHAGPIRVSPLALEFALAAPALVWFVVRNRSRLSCGAIDLLLITALIFVVIRGSMAATDGNELGLTLAFGGYIILLYYGAAIVGQNGLRVLFGMLVTMGIIAAAYALVEFVLKDNILYGGIIKKSLLPYVGKGYHRSSSTLGQPDVLGIFMIQVAPFIIFFFLRAAGKVRTALWGAAILLVSLALLVTYSKGSWIAALVLTVAGLGWLVWRRRVLSKRLLILMLVLAVGIGFFTSFFYSTVQAGTISKARTSESIKPREYMWARVPRTFLANALFGAGLYQGNAEIFRVNPAPNLKNRPTAIDNLYMTVIVEQGLVGTILIAGAFWSIGSKGFKTIRTSGFARSWGWPLVASMAAVLIEGVVTSNLMIWPIMVVFWLIAGMLRALAQVSERQEHHYDKYDSLSALP